MDNHRKAFDVTESNDKFDKLADLIEKYGLSKIEKLLQLAPQAALLLKTPNPTVITTSSTTQSPVLEVKNENVPKFATEPEFNWASLGHFNKSVFVNQEIENCKKLKDKVKEYEDQRQKMGLSKKDALVRLNG